MIKQLQINARAFQSLYDVLKIFLRGMKAVSSKIVAGVIVFTELTYVALGVGESVITEILSSIYHPFVIQGIRGRNAVFSGRRY